MATTATCAVKIVKHGGPVSKDVYKAFYSAGTATSEDWVKGELLYLVAGYLKRIGTGGSAAEVDTDDTGYATANKRFMALTDHDSSVEGESVFVAVQEITSDTVLELQVAASSTTAPTQVNVAQGTAYTAYMSDDNVVGLNVDGSGAKGLFVVTDKDSETKWMIADTGVAGTNGSGKFVRATMKQALFL